MIPLYSYNIHTFALIILLFTLNTLIQIVYRPSLQAHNRTVRLHLNNFIRLPFDKSGRIMLFVPKFISYSMKNSK